jgi:hypothetical protein
MCVVCDGVCTSGGEWCPGGAHEIIYYAGSVTIARPHSSYSNQQTLIRGYIAIAALHVCWGRTFAQATQPASERANEAQMIGSFLIGRHLQLSLCLAAASVPMCLMIRAPANYSNLHFHCCSSSSCSPLPAAIIPSLPLRVYVPATLNSTRRAEFVMNIK